MDRERVTSGRCGARRRAGGGAAKQAVRAIAGALLCCTAFAAAAADGEPRPANGLIVKLRDASAHSRAQALGAGHASEGGATQRLQRVLATAGITRYAAQPSGRAAQRLDFGRVLAGAEAHRIAAQLRANPEVEWVVANEREQRLQSAPNDPYFAQQWWLATPGGSNANAIEDRRRGLAGFEAAWTREPGRASAVVAILDTGITAHPDLAGNVLPGYDFVSTIEYANDGDGRDADASDPGDWVSDADRGKAAFDGCEKQYSSWHGTQIAGIVGAVTGNGIGIASTSHDARVLPLRVAGKCGAEVADIVDAMRWAAGLDVASGAGGFLPANPNPARIVSISFGSEAACNPAYQSAIDELAAHGVVVVAAAGNQHTAPMRPANCQGVIGVAALNRDGFKATYSNFGAGLVVATVGGDPDDEGEWGELVGDGGIVTLDNAGRTAPKAGSYARVFGSSYSAPIVAGAVSLMLSANPQLSAAQIVTGLKQSARPHVTSPAIGTCSQDNPGRCICTTQTCGAGVLDVAEAVRYAQTLATGSAFVAKRWPVEVISNPEVAAAVALGADLPPNAKTDATQGAIASAGGGGGALGPLWLLGLAASVAAVARARRSRGR